MMRITIFISMLLVSVTVSAQGKNPIQDMVLLSENLKTCTPYAYDFIHPESGDVLQRTIKGEVGGKCLYVEGMPDGDEMSCLFASETAGVVAEYYERLALSRANVKTNVEQAVSTINENPLEKALEDGTCTVKGDEQKQ
ncbi:MAG: hypothetical protein HUJ31_00160 [Pseudomonadales bacterium]|nr:hypothetical protein [Pseudomonadales bacterium]